MSLDGVFVCLNPDEESKDKLDAFVEKFGLSERLDPDTYHVTVIYSQTPIDDIPIKKPFTLATPNSCTGTPVEWEVFPTKTEGKCLVLRIDSRYAAALNRVLLNNGATSTYPSYKCHMTVAYNIKDVIEPSELPIPDFDLNFTTITWKPLDETFVPKNKTT